MASPTTIVGFSSIPGAALYTSKTVSDMQKLSLEERVQENCAYFDALMDLIPTKLYLHTANAGPLMGMQEEAGKFQRHKKKDPAAQESVKLAKKAAKKAKLDPSMNVKTMLERKQEADASAAQLVESQANVLLTAATSADRTAGIQSASSAPATIQDLKSRLHARIVAFEQRRGGHSKHAAVEQSQQQQQLPANKSREQILAERKQRKLEEEALKKKKESMELQRNATSEIPQGLSGSSKHATAQKRAAMDPLMEEIPEDLDYARVTFRGDAEEAKKKRRKLDAKTALLKAEKQQQKLSEIEAKDHEKAQAIKESMKWQKALSMATGSKQQDDPKLLKKTIKRLEKKKSKSKAQWDERKERVESELAERQRKRTENLQKRKDAKKEKGKSGKKASGKKTGGPKAGGAKKGKKKGRAGFEGK